MKERAAKNIFYTSFIFLMTFGAFGYGVLVGVYKFWPYETLDIIQTNVRVLLETGVLAPEGRVVRPAKDASREPFTIYDSKHTIDGYYAFLGWDNTQSKYAIWLYDNKGTLLHRWLWDYQDLDANGPRNLSDSPHGMQVLTDGSVVVNFDKGDVMARLDACSKPIWIKDGIFHHSIDSDEYGYLWTWRGEGTAYGEQQFLVQFDPETG